jgi:hypothetical protein
MEKLIPAEFFSGFQRVTIRRGDELLKPTKSSSPDGPHRLVYNMWVSRTRCELRTFETKSEAENIIRK